MIKKNLLVTDIGVKNFFFKYGGSEALKTATVNKIEKISKMITEHTVL